MMRFPFCAPALAVCLAAAALCVPAAASAQLRVEVGLPGPGFQIQIGGPLVYVGPGVWVLPDSNEEVFYNNGWYWARSHDHWYRSHARRGGWGVVEERYVPRPLLRVPPGRYRDYRAPEHARRMAPPGWAKQGHHSEQRHTHWKDKRDKHQPRALPAMQVRHPVAPGPAPMRREDHRRGGHGEGGHGHGKGGGHGHGRGH